MGVLGSCGTLRWCANKLRQRQGRPGIPLVIQELGLKLAQEHLLLKISDAIRKSALVGKSIIHVPWFEHHERCDGCCLGHGAINWEYRPIRG